MKAKEFLYLLGIRPPPRTFGWVIETHHLGTDGVVEVAQWQHPRAYRVAPTQAAVDQFRRVLRPGDVAIDIGAHTGDTAIPMALAAGPQGAVLALEPNPHVFPVLARNAALNPGKMRILAYPFAAMRTDGPYQFHYGEPGYCNGGYHEGMSRWRHASAYPVDVEGRNLQQLLAREHPELIPRVRFIKIDTEGFDLAVLESISELLTARRPILQVEMFDLKRAPAGYRERLYLFLVRHQYIVYRVANGDLFGEAISPENLLRWRSCDACCVPAEERDLPVRC